MDSPLPLVPYLMIREGRAPVLEGQRCSHCSATFLDARQHCAGCGERDCLQRVELGRTGRLHAFSVIYRSFPEVAVPYVSAVVDLDGGGTLKANLLGVEPDPQHIEVGMAVALDVFVPEQRDDQGRAYLAPCFRPLQEQP